jgi:nicotinamidase-related amidase
MGETALLVIDVQKGLFKKKNKIFNEDILMRNINFLIDKSREKNIPIIFIRHTNKSFLLENSEDWHIHPALKACSDDIYLNKAHSSIFAEKRIVKQLESRGIRNLIITGLVTHGCVKAACLDAKNSGYEVVLVEDGHSNFNDNPQELIDEWNEKMICEDINVIPTMNVYK